MRQEGRHIVFYASEAERRLTGDCKAQRLVRTALRHLWRPVGSGVMPRSEVAFMVTTLFGDDRGRAMAQRIDQRVDRLPGLDGLRLVEGALASYRPAAGTHTADLDAGDVDVDDDARDAHDAAA